LSSIGQTYGAASAVLSVLALGDDHLRLLDGQGISAFGPGVWPTRRWWWNRRAAAKTLVPLINDLVETAKPPGIGDLETIIARECPKSRPP
jgi:hypothetical protein